MKRVFLAAMLAAFLYVGAASWPASSNADECDGGGPVIESAHACGGAAGLFWVAYGPDSFWMGPCSTHGAYFYSAPYHVYCLYRW